MMKIFSKIKKTPEKMFPLVATKDMVLFPQSSSPVYVQRNAALQSIEEAMGSKRIVVLAYYNGSDTRLVLENLNEYATLARIVQVLRLPNNNSRVLLEGMQRIHLSHIEEDQGNFRAFGEIAVVNNYLDDEVKIRMKALQENFRTFAGKNKRIPREILQAVDNSHEPHNLMDQILAHINMPYQKKLSFFNNLNTMERMDNLALELESEKNVLNLKEDISRRVKKRMHESHREFVINEQIKELNKELGKDEDSDGIKEFEHLLSEREFPPEVHDKANTELKRLKRLQPISPEAGILRGYLEWITSLPWMKHSEDIISIEEADRILNEDHYDMEEPKDRILDFLAVLQMNKNLKGPILCFVGPPGTGKTSLGKSLARAMGRKFVRVSLGGIRDEAEIRGHRRTYVGALPGKIVQGLKRAETSNPVFLLDEIDKLGTDHRGDPSSALLEVLDPEQNRQFHDHYMEIPVDLSRVFFITTANSLHGIPYPLLDRMEIIQIPGYTRIEKLKIAEGFIIPKQLNEHGLEWADISFSKNAIGTIIDNYTRESGVRNLEREIAKAVRKIARKAVEEGKIHPRPQNEHQLHQDDTVSDNAPAEKPEDEEQRQERSEKPETALPEFKYQVGPRDIKKFLGTRKFDIDLLFKENPPGLVYGMAWTELGGKLLPVEAIILNKDGT
ncbi:MAG: endopeptidase La, partial [Salinispira sp.]